jgi:3-deoxy-manno-octulosonate cytidylyltransferase (CMP-KDO synthetase)
MRVIAIIPARMGSSRFPGKPLQPLLGKPMIGHVYERVRRNAALSEVVVATCDGEIRDYVTSIGGKAVMTSAAHQRASDRCAEALDTLERESGIRYDVVVMVQGDEPMVDPAMIDEALQPLLDDPEVQVVNLLGEIHDPAELDDPNCIKVVVDRHLNALYMSRSAIPNKSVFDASASGKQVCIIPFRADYLRRYLAMEPTPLEVMESIDMLRILEHGERVRMAHTRYQTYPVDTPADLQRVEALLGQH